MADTSESPGHIRQPRATRRSFKVAPARVWSESPQCHAGGSSPGPDTQAPSSEDFGLRVTGTRGHLMPVLEVLDHDFGVELGPLRGYVRSYPSLVH